jgi:hypothetical protein
MPTTKHLSRTAAPETLLLSLEDTKLHLRITTDDDDDYIESLIAAAAEACMAETGLSLINTQYCLTLNAWPAQPDNRCWWDGLREGAMTQQHLREMTLPRPPLVSVSAIENEDGDGNLTTYAVTHYFTDTGTPGRVILKTSAPAPDGQRIKIHYTAGYGTTPESIPPALRQGLRQMVAHMYENRGDDAAQAMVSSGAGLLFRPFRQVSIA